MNPGADEGVPLRMRLLALDTALASCSVALWADGAVTVRRRDMARGHAEALMPMIGAVLKAGPIGFADLDGLAVTIGPGYFTGLRIGLAAARGLALAAGLPLVGVTTLAAVAAEAEALAPAETFLVALESKREDLYGQAFAAGGRPLTPPLALPPSDLAAALLGALSGARFVLAGDGAARLGDALGARRVDILSPTSTVPLGSNAAFVAAIAARQVAGGWPAVDAPPPAPLYMRPPDVTRPGGVGVAR